MPKDSRKGYQLYYSLLAVVLTFAVIFWANEHFVLRVHIIFCILYGLIPAVCIYLFDKNKKNTIAYLVLLSLLPVGGLILLISRTNPITMAARIAEWIIRYDRTEDLYKTDMAYTVLAALSLLVSILFYLGVKKLITRFILGAAVAAVFVVFSIANIQMGKIAVGIGIFYLMNVLIEIGGMLYGKKDKKESIFYLLPVCILLAVFAAGLPSRQEPLQWSGVKSFYYLVRDRIDKLVTQWEFFVSEGEGIFRVALSGYSENGSLDNKDLSRSQKVALIVTGRRGVSPIYLTGSVSDTYTGSSWEKSGEDSLADEQEYQMDYAELLYGLSRLDAQVLEDYRLVETRPLKILYNSVKTRTFFYPAKTSWFEFDKGGHKPDAEYAGITFSKAVGDKIAYNLSYYEMNLQEPSFQEMLRMSDDFSYDEVKDIDLERLTWAKSQFYVRDKEHFVLGRPDFYELYRKRADVIYKRYTQLPENLPERVKELADELTKNEKTRYDKLKAIEAYLLDFEYSYTPGRTPKGEDFADYFLFSNKKGYCTSFATAMAVLGRSAGIPTRYVEGYVVNYDDRGEVGYLVRNSNAHAWAEAYFDGVGWIPFEATPSFHEQRYTEWAPKRKYEDNVTYDYSREEAASPVPGGMDSGIEATDTDKENNGLILWLAVAAAAILIILIILISYYHLLRKRYKKEFEKSDYSMKMYKTFLRVLTLLRYEGFTLGAEDTLLMLAGRVKDRYQYEEVVFYDVVNIFMAYRYGEIPLTDKDYDTVSVFYEGLKEQHKKDSSAFKLHMEEFLFLIKRNGEND